MGTVQAISDSQVFRSTQRTNNGDNFFIPSWQTGGCKAKNWGAIALPVPT